MISLTNKQMGFFNLSVKENFINDTARKLPKYYPGWCANKNELEIKAFVNLITSFAHQHYIFESHNIFDLIHYEINYNILELLQNDDIFQKEFGDSSKDEFDKVDYIKLYLIANS